MEVEDMEDTLAKNQEWEIIQEEDKNQVLEKNQEKKKKKKSQIQAIDLHMEGQDQDLEV